jgi:hypothetical protein
MLGIEWLTIPTFWVMHLTKQNIMIVKSTLMS